VHVATTGLVLAAGALLAWLLCFALTMLATRPVLRGTGAESGLPPPAIAALLCPPNGRVPRRAATATLLDLIARGRLVVAADGGGQQWVRLATRQPGPALLPHEAHVLDHVTARVQVAGGALPLGALRLESSQHARRWYERFTELVVADARELGLVRDRAGMPVRVLLRLALVTPAGLAGAAAVAGHQAMGLFYVLIGYLAMTTPVRLLRRPVPRGAGVPAAVGCRALRDELARYPLEAAVPTGDRRPGYAVGLGVARWSGAAEPFTPGGDRVWSVRRGRWLRVVDPPALLSGTSPGTIFALIVPTLLFATIWAVLLGYLTLHFHADWTTLVWPVALLGLGWTVWGTGIFLFLRRIWYAIEDLVRPLRVIVGQVVYLESDVSPDPETADNYYVAVDDGATDPVRKYPIGRGLHDRLRYGSWLRLDVRARSGAVEHVEVVAAPGPAYDAEARAR
jgi:hypothetical protein